LTNLDCISKIYKKEILKMSNAITFDTLAYVKKLKAAGVPEAQAEVQAEAFAQIIEDKPVTKEYLKTELAHTEARIIKWVAAMLVAQAAVVATLVKLL